MQTGFEFTRSDNLAALRDALKAQLGPMRDGPRRDPVGQFVYSLISARTYDAVSLTAFVRLRQAFPEWEIMAEARNAELEEAISEVTYAERKAPYLRAALRMIRSRVGRIDLEFLRDWEIGIAMRWLMALPGAGPKVAAATLNFSTLARRAFVVDTHVLRVLQRLGFVSPKADIAAVCEAAMQGLPDFDADDFYELHWLLKRLGQTLCTHAGPQCGGCPLGAMCEKHMSDISRGLLSGERPQAALMA